MLWLILLDGLTLSFGILDYSWRYASSCQNKGDNMETLLNGLADFIIMIINFLIAGVGVVLSWLAMLFPDSPFKEPSGAPESVNLGWVTWLIPFPTMITHLFLLCGAALVYYGIRVLSRWIKMTKG